jgi:hypothetical protein
MKKKMRMKVLARNHATPRSEPIKPDGQGSATHGKKCHPPKNKVVKIAEPMTT